MSAANKRPNYRSGTRSPAGDYCVFTCKINSSRLRPCAIYLFTYYWIRTNVYSNVDKNNENNDEVNNGRKFFLRQCRVVYEPSPSKPVRAVYRTCKSMQPFRTVALQLLETQRIPSLSGSTEIIAKWMCFEFCLLNILHQQLCRRKLLI